MNALKVAVRWTRHAMQRWDQRIGGNRNAVALTDANFLDAKSAASLMNTSVKRLCKNPGTFFAQSSGAFLILRPIKPCEFVIVTVIDVPTKRKTANEKLQGSKNPGAQAAPGLDPIGARTPTAEVGKTQGTEAVVPSLAPVVPEAIRALGFAARIRLKLAGFLKRLMKLQRSQ